MSGKVYAYISFEAKENGVRNLLDCELYATQKEARKALNNYVADVIRVYSESYPDKEYPIRSVGDRYYHEINIPRECTPDNKALWLTVEIRELQLPEEKGM